MRRLKTGGENNKRPLFKGRLIIADCVGFYLRKIGCILRKILQKLFCTLEYRK